MSTALPSLASSAPQKTWGSWFSSGWNTATGAVSSTAAAAASKVKSLAAGTPVAPITSTDGATAALGTAPGDVMLGGRRRKTGKKSRKIRKKTRKH